MWILFCFAFLAGIATVLSPCVLPILPALLSAGAVGGYLRPIGIVLGVVCSFTFFTLMLTSIVQLTGISPDFLRYIAIALIAGFGVLMIFPRLSETFAKATSGVAQLGQSVQTQSARLGSGFWSGFILGIALGLVWTPCAGPILGAITTLVATSTVTWTAFFMTLSYTLGAAIPMLALIYGGKKIASLSRGVAGYSEWIRKGFGCLMILAALAMAFHFDVQFQTMATQYIPFVNVEDNSRVRKELEKLRTGNANSKFVLPDEEALTRGALIPEGIKVPELTGIVGWVNTEPLTMESLRGKVVLIDFWTYSCINCIRTFPYLKDWYAKYKDKGLVIVGVHTPEFEFEKNVENVREAVKRFGLEYPIAIDSQFKTWQSFNNHYWPAHYLVDQQGFVRSVHFGEGSYPETENAIRSLLGMDPLHMRHHQVESQLESQMARRPITPETYLGYSRGHKYTQENPIQPNQTALYDYRQHLRDDQVGLRGDWFVEEQKITSERDFSEVNLNFLATQVYVVMESPEPARVSVLLDGRPLERKNFTADMDESGQIIVREARKYDAIDLKGEYGRHLLTLRVPKGVSLYVFTFGNRDTEERR